VLKNLIQLNGCVKGAAMEITVYQSEIETIVCEHLEKHGYKIPRNEDGSYNCKLGNNLLCEEYIELTVDLNPWDTTGCDGPSASINLDIRTAYQQGEIRGQA
jgi:hypothetical protein